MASMSILQTPTLNGSVGLPTGLHQVLAPRTRSPWGFGHHPFGKENCFTIFLMSSTLYPETLTVKVVIKINFVYHFKIQYISS
jgi:hypothetical protein